MDIYLRQYKYSDVNINAGHTLHINPLSITSQTVSLRTLVFFLLLDMYKVVCVALSDKIPRKWIEVCGFSVTQCEKGSDTASQHDPLVCFHFGPYELKGTRSLNLFTQTTKSLNSGISITFMGMFIKSSTTACRLFLQTFLKERAAQCHDRMKSNREISSLLNIQQSAVSGITLKWH